MFLPGNPPTNVLAVLAAVATAVAAVPHPQCVCPDGRAKLFCTGASAYGGCCCSAPSGLPGAAACCDPAVGKPRSCCGHTDSSCPPAQGAGPTVVGACGCKRSVVVPSAAAVFEEVGDDSRADGGTAGGWDSVPEVARGMAPTARPAQRSPLPPPDLVVLLCHFTC